MRRFLLLIIGSMFFVGCLVSRPKPINEAYLQNRTEKDQKRIESLEDEIIALKQRKDKTDKSLKITKQQLTVSKKTIETLENQKKMLQESEKLYALENDEEKMAQSKQDIQENSIKLKEEQIKKTYLAAKKEDEEAYIELTQAELGVKVAQLDLIKARIAHLYIEKKLSSVKPAEEGVDGEEGDKKIEKIEIAEYEKYLDRQKERLVDKQELRDKTLQEFKKAEIKYKK